MESLNFFKFINSIKNQFIFHQNKNKVKHKSMYHSTCILWHKRSPQGSIDFKNHKKKNKKKTNCLLSMIGKLKINYLAKTKLSQYKIIIFCCLIRYFIVCIFYIVLLYKMLMRTFSQIQKSKI